MQDSAELHRVSSTIESAQERWLNSDPAHQYVLKQQSNEDDTEVKCENELEKETFKQSGSMERGDALFKQSKLEDEALSDDNLSGSLEREDDSLIQSELEDEALSDDKPSGSIERDNDSLKHSSLEADQPTAKTRSYSSLDSVPSKRTKKITPLTLRKNFTGKHVQTSF